MNELKSYYQLYSKDGNVGKFKYTFDKHRKCPICGKSSIESHSISKKYLATIANNNQEVLRLPHLISDKNFHDFLELKPISHVSTFFGFCDDHDINLFKPLENFDGLPDSNKFGQNEAVLMSLRAVAYRDYIDCLMLKITGQYDKYAEQRFSSHLKSTKRYLDIHIQALSNPNLLYYFTFIMPLEFHGNFLCAEHNDGISVVSMPLDNGQLVSYVIGSVAANKLHIYWNSPDLVILKSLNNIAVSPDWWSTRDKRYKDIFLRGAFSGKTVKTIYHGQVKETKL